MTRRSTILAAAISAALAGHALGQTTRPAFVDVTYTDSTQRRIFDLSPELVAAIRASEPPATRPTTAPTTKPADPPPLDPRGVYVAVGESWTAALKAAKPGQIVYLAAGKTYPGESLTDPAVRLTGVSLAAWPPGGAKATIRVSSGMVIGLWFAQSIGLYDLNFVADRPTSPGLRFLPGCRDISMVRCEISGFTFGYTTEGSKGVRIAGFNATGCYIHDNYHPLNQDGSGAFSSMTDGIVERGNVYDHNGWGGTVKGNIRSHNRYIAGDCGPPDIQGCTFKNASSHGLQCRAGGIVEGNLFLDNPIHLSYGLVNGGGPIVVGGVAGSIARNSFVGTRLLAGQPRGWAIEVGNVKQLIIEKNAFACEPFVGGLGTSPFAVKIDLCNLDPANLFHGKDAKKPLSLTIRDNVGSWPAGMVWVNPGAKTANIVTQSEWPAVDVADARHQAEIRGGAK